ncbi:MAG: LysR substrate-binding domain-containing protein [Rhizobiaceae bacterium]
MKNLRQLLPSAGGLIVFEAAGRLASFTEAGRELGMSQAAVSYAIKALEAQLGTALFSRRHRRVHLTEAGARFHGDVALGLGAIRASAEMLRARSAETHVTLSGSTAFASMWMVPRLGEAREALPGIDLRLQTSDRDLDIAAENIPLGIRGGDPALWPAYHASAFAAESIIAVASPAYAARYGTPQDVRGLAEHNLIHLEEPHRPAATWNDWFRSAGLALPSKNRGLLINDYVLVIQAALNGQGVALGWRHLVAPMLADGRLVALGGHEMTTGSAFHVIWRKDRVLGADAVKVRDWLIEAGGRTA